MGAGPADAATDASQVVISEVYGGGGSTTSAWQRDYVELYNPTDQAVDLSGTSVQYRSSGGTSNPTGVTALTGSVPAKGYFLVGEGNRVGRRAGAGTGSQRLHRHEWHAPAPSSSPTRPRALPAPPTGSLTGDPAVLDLVGYGTSNTYESAAAAATSTSTSLERNAAGADTDDNANDLVIGSGTPGIAPHRRSRRATHRSRRRSPRSRAPATPARSPARRSRPRAS